MRSGQQPASVTQPQAVKLAKSTQEIDEKITILKQCGDVKIGSDQVAYETLTKSEQIKFVEETSNLWAPYSKALTTIIGTPSLAGENFTNVLRGRISDTDLNTTQQFIEQLYNPRVKEKLVDALNPLHKVMLHNASNEKGANSRFLDFKFPRVYEDKSIARILVNINDVSDAVYLEQRLEKERSQNDMQIEMLTTILNVEPTTINEFISNTKLYIEKMNSILKNTGSSQY